MSNSPDPEQKAHPKELKFTGERLVKGQRILRPQRIENLARFDFFTKYLSEGRVLDYGCGAGEGTYFINKIGNYNVIGFDLSFDAIHYAKNNWGEPVPDFVCGNVLTPGLKMDSFDGVISVEVIEHIENADRYLENISSLLKSNGLCMLTTPNRLVSSPKASGLWPDHVKEYEPQELLSLCNRYFKEVTIYGESIPVYEENSIRKLVRKLSPTFKPILPKWLRIRVLPFLFSTIKSDITTDDVKFITANIASLPTIVAICRMPIK